MAEDLEASAMLAYETYRQACEGRNAAGLPMPAWEHVSVPDRDAWTRVASAVTGIPLPAPAPEAPLRQVTPVLDGSYTQEDLEALTVTQLRELATDAGVSLPASATKQVIIDALLAAQAGGAP